MSSEEELQRTCFSYIFSSTEDAMISLYTTTSFFWPILKARSTACLSSAGFQEGSNMITRSAPGGVQRGARNVMKTRERDRENEREIIREREGGRRERC